MAKNNAPKKDEKAKKVAPVSLCQSCKRNCRSAVMVVQKCGKFLPQ